MFLFRTRRSGGDIRSQEQETHGRKGIQPRTFSGDPALTLRFIVSAQGATVMRTSTTWSAASVEPRRGRMLASQGAATHHCNVINRKCSDSICSAAVGATITMARVLVRQLQ